MVIILNHIPHVCAIHKTPMWNRVKKRRALIGSYGSLSSFLPGLSGSVRPKTEACDRRIRLYSVE